MHREDDPTRVTIPGFGPVSSRTLVVAAIIVAVLVRAIWAWRYGLSIEQEGVDYTKIAENLFKGRGYVGIFNNGTQLNFPPLYPLLIGLVSFLTGTTELAARVVNIALGAALVIPMFGISERLYGQRVAWMAAILTALHPVLIAGGASTYAEGPYVTFLMFGVYWLIKWVTERRMLTSAVAGMFFGMAYLVRPEPFVLIGAYVAAAIAFSFWMSERRSFYLGAAALVGAFVLVALPNIIFLTIATGKVRIEAKGTLGWHWGSRMNAGMSYEEAIMGIDNDLHDTGVFMRPNLDVLNDPPPTRRQYLAFLLQAVKRNVKELERTIMDERAFGAPILFVLVVVGLLGQPWTRQRASLEVVLLMTLGLSVLVLLTVQALWFRYFYGLLVMLLIWGAKGAETLSQWGRESTMAIFGVRRERATTVGRVLEIGSVATVLAIAAVVITNVGQFQESLFPERKTVGKWMATQAREPWVMDTSSQAAYYSGGSLRYLPYSSGALALRYIEKHKPDFIVLHSTNKTLVPYGAEWYDSGIPDTRAVLVHQQNFLLQEDIKVYRWIP